MSYAPAPPPPGTNAFAILGEDTVHCPALRLPPQKLEPPYPLRNLVLFWPSPPSPPARFTSPPDPATPTPPDAYTVEAVDGFPPVATIPLNVELPPFVASVPPAPITTAKFVMSAILNHFIPVDPDAPPAPEKLSPAAPPLKAPPPPSEVYSLGRTAGWNACRAAMLHGAEPVSQTYNLPELIEGMEVSIDVSTCDADLGNRYFGTVTEALELDTAKNGYILLVQDAEPNFDVNGNSPVTPDGWISCSERMPEDGQHVIILCDGAFVLYAQYRDGEFFDIVRNGDEFFETQSRNVTDWMQLPEPPL